MKKIFFACLVVTLFATNTVSAQSNVVIHFFYSLPNNICAGDSTTLHWDASGPIQWVTLTGGGFNNDTIPTSGTRKTRALSEPLTSFGLLVMDTSGRITTQVISIHTYSCETGIPDLSDQKTMQLFPNPVTATLHVETTEMISSGSIVDMLGNEVAKIVPQQSNNNNVDITFLTPGVYFFRGTIKGKPFVTKKFIKQ